MKVSIITVSFNSEKTINDTFRSIRNQNYNNIEYIVVDGNSSDNTLKIIKQNSDISSKSDETSEDFSSLSKAAS